MRARVKKVNVSTMLATVTSDCPTPTVSTQHHVVAGGLDQHDRLPRRLGDTTERAGRRGRSDMASGWAASRPMRVLSPRIDPPVRVDDGSTASTATRCPCEIRYIPSVSIVVDFPQGRR